MTKRKHAEISTDETETENERMFREVLAAVQDEKIFNILVEQFGLDPRVREIVFGKSSNE